MLCVVRVDQNHNTLGINICHRRLDYMEACTNLIQSLIIRGYKAYRMHCQANYIWTSYHDDRPNIATDNDDNRIFFALEYNAMNRSLANVIRTVISTKLIHKLCCVAWQQEHWQIITKLTIRLTVYDTCYITNLQDELTLLF